MILSIMSNIAVGNHLRSLRGKEGWLALVLATIVCHGTSGFSAAGRPVRSLWQTPELAHLEAQSEQLVHKYQTVLATNPDDLSALMALGELHLFRGQYKTARGMFARAEELAPQDPYIPYYIGHCLLNMDWRYADAARSFQQAVDLAAESQDKSFPLADAYLQIGKSRYHAYMIHEALAPLQRAAHLDPTLSEVPYYLGLCAYNYAQGDTDQAWGHFSAALKLDPDHADSLYYLGTMAYHDRDFTTAREYFQRCLDADPARDDVFYWMGIIHKELRDMPEAIAFFQKAADAGPDNQWSRYELAKLYYDQGDIASAITELEYHVQGEYTPPEHYQLLADCYRSVGQFDKEKEVWRQYGGLSWPKAAGFVLICLLPVAWLAWLGHRILKKMAAAKSREDKVALYHQFRKASGRTFFTGIFLAMLAFHTLQIHIWEKALHIPHLNVGIFSVLFLLIYSLMNVVSFQFDRRARGTQAPLRAYARFYFGFMLGLSIHMIIAILCLVLYVQSTEFWFRMLALGLFLLATYGAGMLAPRFFVKVLRAVPIPDGDTRQRLLALCAQTGVVCREIYLVPTRVLQYANAFATGLQGTARYVFFCDHLLDILDPNEQDAIFLHELGHHKFGHIRKQTLVLILVFLIFAWAHDLAARFVPAYSWLITLVVILCGFAMIQRFSRRHEEETDAFVATQLSDPEVFTRSLDKLYANNFIPRKWKGPRHPSLEKRVANINRDVFDKT